MRFNPRLPNGRRQRERYSESILSVSIHASQTGGDRRRGRPGYLRCVSIHASQTGGDIRPLPWRRIALVSIHASQTGGDFVFAQSCTTFRVSIHASQTGGDVCPSRRVSGEKSFNPRLPNGRRPRPFRTLRMPLGVSIHASQTGGDRVAAILPTILLFQSTPPKREATKAAGNSCSPYCRFQSTPPKREATRAVPFRHNCKPCFNPRLPNGRRQGYNVWGRRSDVSIHASQTGGDLASTPAAHNCYGFNPRLPNGRRRRHAVPVFQLLRFNPRLPNGRRRLARLAAQPKRAFQSTPPKREATAYFGHAVPNLEFQSTPPKREATPG